jgi:excisionase family DNA binding protein
MQDILTVSEAAAILRVSPQRLRLLLKQGRLPARRLGRDWAIDARDLAAYSPRPTGRPKGNK